VDARTRRLELRRRAARRLPGERRPQRRLHCRKGIGHDRKGRKVTEPVQIIRATFKDSLQPGDNAIQHRCPRDLTAVRTGFETEATSNA
jgi:hypothetical protein